jgi:hypothetical protein
LLAALLSALTGLRLLLAWLVLTTLTAALLAAALVALTALLAALVLLLVHSVSPCGTSPTITRGVTACSYVFSLSRFLPPIRKHMSRKCPRCRSEMIRILEAVKIPNEPRVIAWLCAHCGHADSTFSESSRPN